jgi:hypothetical protein
VVILWKAGKGAKFFHFWAKARVEIKEQSRDTGQRTRTQLRRKKAGASVYADP